MRVPFFDLRVSDSKIKRELLGAVERVLDHGLILLGPEVTEFENKVAKAIGVKHAVGLSSGSSALYLALKCLDIGPGDEVITTPLTWIITGNAIVECGATPIFVDSEPETWNICPNHLEEAIKDRIAKGKKPKAIMDLLSEIILSGESMENKRSFGMMPEVIKQNLAQDHFSYAMLPGKD